MDRVFQIRARSTGCAFWTQSERFAVMFERVHLLFDDVGGVSDRAHEKGSGFEVRRAYFPEAGARHGLCECAFDHVASPDGIGEHVVHTFDGSE
jgi:hypothetical protein